MIAEPHRFVLAALGGRCLVALAQSFGTVAVVEFGRLVDVLEVMAAPPASSAPAGFEAAAGGLGGRREAAITTTPAAEYSDASVTLLAAVLAILAAPVLASADTTALVRIADR